MAWNDPYAADSTAQRSNSGMSGALVFSDNGQLSDDFLRLPPLPPASAGANSSPPANTAYVSQPQTQARPTTASGAHSYGQIAADEQLARALQAAELNGPAAPAAARGAAYPPSAPATYMRRLKITIHQAKLQKNYGLLKMDPYCKVRVGNTEFATTTSESGGKNPVWNRTINCPFHTSMDTIYLELFDEGTFADDERIAWAHIDIPEQTLRGNRVIDWYPLSGKQGDGKEGLIQLAMQVETVAAAAPTVYYAPAVVPGGYYAPPMVPLPAAAAPYAYPLPAYAVAAPPRPAGPPTQPQPRPTAAPVAISDDDVTQLKEMFANLQISVIRNVLESTRGNKEEAINHLLMLAADATPVQTQAQAAQLHD